MLGEARRRDWSNTKIQNPIQEGNVIYLMNLRWSHPLPKLIHVTCVVHAIHCVCEIIGEENVKVNRLFHFSSINLNGSAKVKIDS